jgi:osmoprotectant transport system substrate-binding protein
MSRTARRALPALLLTGALVLSACGDDSGTGDSASAEGGGGGTDVDLSGVSLSVGSKEFTEQLVLGQVVVQALEAAGADVTDKTNLTGTAVVRQALDSGEIDLYYEYTGTGWITILGETEPVPGAEEQFEAVKEADAANGITWFARAEANNTFAIAANAEAVEELGVETISDWAEVVNEDPSAGRLCSSAEFINRDDGLPGVEETYGFDLPADQVVQLEPALVYTQVGAGDDCDFAVVFATDGQIRTQDLTVLEDDQQFFPPYNLAVTMRTEAYEANAEELEELFGQISGELTDDRLIELNSRVDVDGEDPRDVAGDFLADIGVA